MPALWTAPSACECGSPARAAPEEYGASAQRVRTLPLWGCGRRIKPFSVVVEMLRPCSEGAGVAGGRVARPPEACQVVRAETPREMAALTRKLVRIAEGKFEPGDLSRRMKRSLLIVGLGACLLLAISVPGAIVIPLGLEVGAGIVGAVAAFVVAWDSLPLEPPPAPAPAS
jgi:hypothetical protein